MAEKYQETANKLLFRDKINVQEFYMKISSWNLGIEQISSQIFHLWKNRLLMKWFFKLF